MNIARSFRDFFRRAGRSESPAPPPPSHAPGTVGGAPPQAAPHAAPTAPPVAQPIPIGGRRPEGPPLPVPAYLRPRSSSPGRNPADSQTSLGTPPSYHSYVPPNHLGAASPPPPATPPPAFQRTPRQGERQLALTDFGDCLGMPPSRSGTPVGLATDRGSLNVNVSPRLDADDRSVFSFTSSLQGSAGHESVSERETPAPRMTGSQAPVTGGGSRFHEHFSDTPPPA